MTDASLPAPRLLGPRLAVMMFLQFFVWGAWYLSVSLYMYAHGMGEVRFYAYMAGPLAAMIAPFFTGLIADRFFATERVLAALFLLAGLFMLLLPVVGGMAGTPIAWETGDDGARIAVAEEIVVAGVALSKGGLFNALILAHMLCYMPTLALTASLSFRHLPEGGLRFPLVRMWGTIGWIAAGFVLALGFTRTLADGTVAKGEMSAVQFLLGGGAAILLGVLCLFLPHTPAPQRGAPICLGTLFFADALRELRRPSFAVFIVGSCLVCIPLAAYYASLQQQMEAMGMTYIAAWKNLGTFLEAGMMFLMPFFFRRLGVKRMILIGIGAWVVRYGLFALGATEGSRLLVILGIALHGICYDFFFVTGQVHVDRATPASIRGQAQSMNVFFTQGLGLFLGARATQWLAERAFGGVASSTAASLPSWPKLWLPLAAMAAGLLVVFALAFRPANDVRASATGAA